MNLGHAASILPILVILLEGDLDQIGPRFDGFGYRGIARLMPGTGQVGGDIQWSRLTQKLGDGMAKVRGNMATLRQQQTIADFLILRYDDFHGNDHSN